jgi:hypothetical protein
MMAYVHHPGLCWSPIGALLQHLTATPTFMAALCSVRDSMILNQLAWVNLQVYTM